MHEDFANTNLPNFVSFGDMGFTIGHEITHGFDKGGSQFDEDGTLFAVPFSKHILQNYTPNTF